VQQFDVGKKWEWVDLLKDFIYLRSEMSYLFALLACSFCSITTIAKGIIPLLKCCMPPMSFLGGGGGNWANKMGTAISAGGTQNMGAQKAGCRRHIRREPDTRQLLVNNHAFSQNPLFIIIFLPNK
jgi:hypothetical protein